MTQGRREREKNGRDNREGARVKEKREREIEISLDNGNLVAALIKQINLVQR